MSLNPLLDPSAWIQALEQPQPQEGGIFVEQTKIIGVSLPDVSANALEIYLEEHNITETEFDTIPAYIRRKEC